MPRKSVEDFRYEEARRKNNPPDKDGMNRLFHAERLEFSGKTLNYVLFAADYPVTALTAPWQDAAGPSERIFAVQTSEKVIKRCILMTTDPGDLVSDPTCGSGTIAYCAEKRNSIVNEFSVLKTNRKQNEAKLTE